MKHRFVSVMNKNSCRFSPNNIKINLYERASYCPYGWIIHPSINLDNLIILNQAVFGLCLCVVSEL